MEKNTVNPKLNYRIKKEIQDEYKQVCEEQCMNPGKLIERFMLDYIENNKESPRE